ncbi:MAG: acyl-CoA dehydrogenase family protein [Xanthobacteraceae bacterium]
MSTSMVRPRDGEGFVQAARALVPAIRAVRADIERERSLPAPLVKRMAETGLFSLWLARALGGPELKLTDYFRVIGEVARADGAAGWCTMVSSGYSRFSGFLTEEVARKIFGGGETIMAGTINPTGKAVPAPGGFRVSGRWGYGSFIGHSAWTIGNCLVHDGEAPRRGADGAPDMRLLLFPTREVEIIDTWRVAGLRGTGSHDFAVRDLFVPEDHGIAGFAATPTQPGTLYAAPFITVFAMCLASVPLGIARAAIEAFTELAKAKTPVGAPGRLRERASAQADLGRAEALVGSARAFMFDEAEKLWETVAAGAAPSLRQRAVARLAAAQAASASAQAVDLLYNAAGGSALHEDNLIERCFRDVHATTQHVGTSSVNFELSGRVLLGLDPGTPRF